MEGTRALLVQIAHSGLGWPEQYVLFIFTYLCSIINIYHSLNEKGKKVVKTQYRSYLSGNQKDQKRKFGL